MGEFDPDFPTTILWQIENIRCWNQDTHDWEILSPQFELNNLGNQWQLSFFPDDRNEFDLCFMVTSFVRISLSLLCDWSLLDADGNTLLKRVVECNPNEDDPTHYMFFNYVGESITLKKKDIFMANDNLTVRLRIKDNKKNFDQLEYISIVTRLIDKSPKESFVWHIENFRTFQLKNEAAATVRFQDNVFRFRVFFAGESLEDANLNFGIASENSNLKLLKVKISFYNEHRRCVRKKHAYSSTESKQTWVVPKLASRQEMLENSFDWVRGDYLFFLCEFEYELRSYVLSCIERSYCGPAEHFPSSNAAGEERKGSKQCPQCIISCVSNEKVQTSLSWERPLSDDRSAQMTAMGSDFFSVYRERILCDFELIVGKASFLVHRFVLSSRSRFFRDFFAKDRDTRSFQVSDLDLETFGRFVTFLYAGTANDLHWEIAAKLYYAAYVYDMPSLRLACSTVLRSDVAVSNVCDALELAERYEDRELMSDVHDFILDHFDEVIFSDQWDRFLERSYLAGKTMKEIYKRKNTYAYSLYG